MPNFTFAHDRKVRRTKTMNAPTLEEAVKKFELFIGNQNNDNFDDAWDEIDDSDPGEWDVLDEPGE